MTKQYLVDNILRVSIHILISITTITIMLISVICFKTVNASGNLYKIKY